MRKKAKQFRVSMLVFLLIVALLPGLSGGQVYASSSADLSDLTLSSGTLSPAFGAGTTSYTVSVDNSVSSLTVTSTTADPTATVR
ncbi:cadherin-like beta sandwich domain-containing protein [Paenibacillus segetis]|uniref:Cadherin-like beta-sandwich-like domain-containing protein n=1 Tax=Paenibacillus segetis TaxID=1325360 RepID=A0ABQ1YLT4_9BACL|nr:cadherin-like beta sandwich domain-containing protein [Paenibacillus segetis]GGH30957.1 hypothetical protein GCM10008013_34390 [Paenibacillus segetis]